MRFFLALILFSFSITCAAETRFYSQISQDQFVHILLYTLSNKQDQGYYLEIGAGHPQYINNTYFFEKNFNWKGISIDISGVSKIEWATSRTNPLVLQDARRLNYASLLKEFPPVIDYLSLDIDRDYDIVLKKLALCEHLFKVITIEHDFYKMGDKYRKAEREILLSLGYHLLCSNVSDGVNSGFEDWWIYPDAFPDDLLGLLRSLDFNEKSHEQVVEMLRRLTTGAENSAP